MNLSTQSLKLRRVGVLSVGLVLGVIYALIGLIAGFFIILISVAAGGVFDQAGFGFLIGAGSIIILPIFYGILGFIFGLIFALIYNLVAKITGGIQMEFES